MKIIKSSSKIIPLELKSILDKRSQQNIPDIDIVVKNIINDVVKQGDEALFNYAKKFDNSNINKSNILLTADIRNSYKEKIDQENMNAFKVAIKNINDFHTKQKPNDYKVENKGIKTSSKWNPIEAVGMYIPGGNANYPSSLLMNVIPAMVAGVKRIVITTPSKNNEINPYILALIDELDIKEVYQVGGAHAIAALAYGTESILPVNKIFGPGNEYVSSAKKQVFGKVGIDLIAGPSEILVVADNKNNPEWVAADLIAQAEHDDKAQCILITDNEKFATEVVSSVKKLILDLPKINVIKNSLDNYGLIIILDKLDNIAHLIDFIAPEHLHLQHQDRYNLLKDVNNAGGIFVGEYSVEAFGDYIAGSNHILPTSGSAKFSSGVGVLDFMKRTSVVEIDSLGYKLNESNVSKMAEVEQLHGHKLSVKIRQMVKI